MNSGKDFIPRAYAALANFLTNLLNKVSEAQIRLGIDAAKLAEFQLAVNEYLAANTIANDLAASSGDLRDRKDLAEAARAATRKFVNSQLRYNDALTNHDREDMGLVIPDHHPTPVEIPTTVPIVIISHPSMAVIELRFRDSEASGKGKPAGIHGAEVAWGTLDTPPVNWKDLNRSSFATHSPLKITFENEDIGKTFYYALRWENNRGEKGPWTPIEKTVIS